MSMTVSLALKYFQDANRTNDIVCVLPKSDIGKCVIKALEKQIPKKPINITKVKDGNKYVGLIGKCPCCNDIVDESNIVCDCGQKLDWESDK